MLLDEQCHVQAFCMLWLHWLESKNHGFLVIKSNHNISIFAPDIVDESMPPFLFTTNRLLRNSIFCSRLLDRTALEQTSILPKSMVVLKP